MIWKFESLNEMKDFANSLGEELKKLKLLILANEVLEFKVNYYTTSTEYLGEFRLALNNVILNADNQLSKEWLDNIKKGISAINKSLKN